MKEKSSRHYILGRVSKKGDGDRCSNAVLFPTNQGNEAIPAAQWGPLGRYVPSRFDSFASTADHHRDDGACKIICLTRLEVHGRIYQ